MGFVSVEMRSHTGLTFTISQPVLELLVFLSLLWAQDLQTCDHTGLRLSFVPFQAQAFVPSCWHVSELFPFSVSSPHCRGSWASVAGQLTSLCPLWPGLSLRLSTCHRCQQMAGAFLRRPCLPSWLTSHLRECPIASPLRLPWDLVCIAATALHAAVPWPLSLLLLQLPHYTSDSPISASRGQGGPPGRDGNVLHTVRS